ncbi:MAG: tryptophan synthase subunit alpha [Actinomycetia bacterium]|nr:tryptophan synthase subunit alpha [Actinomycetes bacterium]
MTNPPIEASFRARREAGRKLLVPYITGGLGDDWPRIIEAVAAAGADAIEVGIPFSDPVMDGPVIQESSTKALAQGANPLAILEELRSVDVDVPLITMGYYNTVFRFGDQRYAENLAEAGVSGAIVPDLSLEECGPWAEAADGAGVETILLAAPTADDDRLSRVIDRARGFVYGVGVLGVTGERDALAASATEIANRLKALTDKPVLIGVGVSNPEQAAEISQISDGVIVGSALVRRILEGAGPDGAGRFVASLRAGLDGT